MTERSANEESAVARAVVEALNYREFLERAIDVFKELQPGYTHSVFCRQAGFKSRNVLRDIVSGRKRVTPTNINPIVNALGLSDGLTRLFALLVQLEEEDLNIAKTPKASLEMQIERQRSLVHERYFQESDLDRSAVFQQKEFLQIYAALGDKNTGSRIEDICSKTGLNLRATEAGLNMLLEKDIVTQVKDRYFPKQDHLLIKRLGEKEFFYESYMQTLDEIRQKEYEEFRAEDQLFMHSYFCVPKSKMTALTTQLSETVVRFVEDNMDDDGDQVSRISVAFY